MEGCVCNKYYMYSLFVSYGTIVISELIVLLKVFSMKDIFYELLIEET